MRDHYVGSIELHSRSKQKGKFLLQIPDEQPQTIQFLKRTFSELELVKNRRLTSRIQTNHQDAHFLLAKLKEWLVIISHFATKMTVVSVQKAT